VVQVDNALVVQSVESGWIFTGDAGIVLDLIEERRSRRVSFQPLAFFPRSIE
jgi:hypothetical protein